MNEKTMNILVVDDERPIRFFLQTALSGQYTVEEAETGLDALQSIAVHQPDVVLLDLGLPDIDGLEVIRRLREWTLVPIIIISVRNREDEQVAALDAGADDYLTKPFNVSELTARIRAALRHCAQPEIESVYQTDRLSVNLARREVLLNHHRVTLTPIEYDLLRSLVLHHGRVITHRQLIKAVWGGNDEVDAHLLRVNISNLRKKIETDPLRPRYIITEPGVGYRIQDMVA